MTGQNPQSLVKWFARDADLTLLLNAAYGGFHTSVFGDAVVSQACQHVRVAQLALEETGSAGTGHPACAPEAPAPPNQPEKEYRRWDAIATEVLSNDDECWVEAHVSAKHLTEVSAYFSTLLQGRFTEARRDPVPGCRRLTLHEVYAPAFVHVLNILHLRHHDVPRRIDPAMLFQVCVLIDMYDIHDALALQTDLWFQDLARRIPTTAAPTLYHWAFICYALKKREAGRRVMRILLRCYTAFPVLQVPLPARYRGTLLPSRGWMC